MEKKRSILFLCTGNSCRSQMAEGLGRALWNDCFDFYSAGIETHGLNPHAVKVMGEIGIDISGQRSKLVSELTDIDFELVVTVCGHAHESCPIFSGKTRIMHVGFDDPPKLAEGLAAGGASEEEQLDCYRRVRDEIRVFVKTLPEVLNTDKNIIREQIRTRYSTIAKEDGSCCGSTSLGDSGFSTRLGYTDDDLSSVPGGANLGLGCGNPQVIAELKEGETVLDLGCGGGFDCFLAAKQVGTEGKIIGIDMTPEMLSKARANAGKGDYTNVEFRLGEIEHLPVADNSVDVIISNCVINLSPEKEQVFCEAYRVLRAQGRLAISDVVATSPLPDGPRRDVDAYCGCVAGAALVSDIEQMLRNAGFSDVFIDIQKDSDRFIRDWFPGKELERYVRSATITAVKR